MKPKLYSCFAIALFAVVFIISCKKGDTGPAGPAGPAGPTGPTGAKGDSATANVTYSAWLDVAYQADTLHDLPDPNAIDTIGFYAEIAAPKLTSTVIAQGEITVYLNLNTAASPVVVPLPYTDVISYPPIGIMPTFIPGYIELYSNAIASTVNTTNGKVRQYRYIIIPGTKPAEAAPGIKWSDYNAVKKYYNIPD